LLSYIENIGSIISLITSPLTPPPHLRMARRIAWQGVSEPRMIGHADDADGSGLGGWGVGPPSWAVELAPIL